MGLINASNRLQSTDKDKHEESATRGAADDDMDMDVDRDAEAEADTDAVGDFFIEDRSGCFSAVLRPRRSLFSSATEGVADMDTEGSLCSLRGCGRRCGVRETCSPIAICAMVGRCAERSGER